MAAAASAVTLSAVSVTFSSADVVHPLQLPWEHLGLFSSYDCAALRRGFQVYRQVCATCHSIDRVHFRELVGVTHTADELVKMAADVEARNEELERLLVRHSSIWGRRSDIPAGEYPDIRG